MGAAGHARHSRRGLVNRVDCAVSRLGVGLVVTSCERPVSFTMFKLKRTIARAGVGSDIPGSFGASGPAA